MTPGPTFRDAKIVNSRERIRRRDGASGIALDGPPAGTSRLRYDVRAGWRRLPPLQFDRTLARVRGGAVARGAVWLLTDDARNRMYRVDIKTGKVAELGSAPPIEGEADGIDATSVGRDDLHATVVAPDRTAVTLHHFTVTGEPAAAEAAAPFIEERRDQPLRPRK
jgi:hypothetical protein